MSRFKVPLKQISRASPCVRPSLIGLLPLLTPVGCRWICRNMRQFSVPLRTDARRPPNCARRHPHIPGVLRRLRRQTARSRQNTAAHAGYNHAGPPKGRSVSSPPIPRYGDKLRTGEAKKAPGVHALVNTGRPGLHVIPFVCKLAFLPTEFRPPQRARH